MSENSQLLKWKNTKVITVNRNGTRMAKNGEDDNGFNKTNLKKEG